jgi:hypothetical protein
MRAGASAPSQHMKNGSRSSCAAPNPRHATGASATDGANLVGTLTDQQAQTNPAENHPNLLPDPTDHLATDLGADHAAPFDDHADADRDGTSNTYDHTPNADARWTEFQLCTRRKPGTVSLHVFAQRTRNSPSTGHSHAAVRI